MSVARGPKNRISTKVMRRSDDVMAVLDLDTVMWGNWAWDFGDLARSACVVAGRMSLDRFSGAAAGYLAGSMVDASVDELVTAPAYVTFMLGLRFLTDHLVGDRYFKINTRGQNLQRAEQQFELLRSIEAQEAEMRAAVSGVLAGGG